MRCRVSISKEAAILAGKDLWGPQVIDISAADLTAEERAEVVRCHSQESGVIDLVFGLEHTHAPKLAEIVTPLEAVRAYLAGRMAQARAETETKAKRAAAEVQRKAEAERQQAEAEAAFLADPEARASWSAGSNCRFFGAPYYVGGGPAYEEAVRRRDADRQADEARKQEEAAAKAAEKAERHAYLADWVLAHGTQNQQERLTANLLPEKEILDLMRDDAFSFLDDLPRYEPIKHLDCCTEDCYCEGNLDNCKIECEVLTPTSVTADQWEQIRAIDRRVEGTALEGKADATFRLHSCSVPCCDGEVERLGIKVTIPAGPFTLSREFAVE